MAYRNTSWADARRFRRSRGQREAVRFVKAERIAWGGVLRLGGCASMSQMRIVTGVDGCARGWVFVRLEDGAFASAGFCQIGGRAGVASGSR